VASARTAAFDAKSNESLTLIARGSGAAYEAAWAKQYDIAKTALYPLPNAQAGALRDQLAAYQAQHQAIRALDDGGQWDQAVAAATTTAAGSANAAFSAFDTASAAALKTYGAQASASLTAPIAWVTVLGWALLLICVGAALLVLRGINERVEEYR
jgi:hypothetical protein